MGNAATNEKSWAKVPRAIIDGLRCGDCLRLYARLDEEQRDIGRSLRGVEAVAKSLGWQVRTAKKHALHLASCGLVELDPAPEPKRGWGHVWFRVAYNPARNRLAAIRPVPNVWEPDVPARWRPPSDPDHVAKMVALRTNAERTAPSPGPEAHRANGLGAPRQVLTTEALHTAPSPSSSYRSVSSSDLQTTEEKGFSTSAAAFDFDDNEHRCDNCGGATAKTPDDTGLPFCQCPFLEVATA